METCIEVTNLSKCFDEKKVLNDVSFSVKKGEIFGLLGPSGAGKTTLLNVITGQLSADEGSTKVLGVDSGKIDSGLYMKMGLLMDNSSLYLRLNCHQNLKVMTYIYKKDDCIIDEVLEKVGLINDKKTQVSKMSKGMQQRLAFAKAIINTPDILFLDEPTTGLDPVTTYYIHNLIRELSGNGTTIVLTTHNMDEATKICDNVGLLCDGKIVEYGKPKDLCYRYREEDSYRIINSNDEEVYVKNNEDGRKMIVEMFKKNKVKTIHTQETTLQSIFIKLTGRDLKDENL